jgi:hypothetical protein
MSPEQKITGRLEQQTPTLSAVQKEALWTKIETTILAPAPIPTPFLFNFINQKTMAPLLLLLALITGTTGTVLAANDARPGDTLYPVDLATEKVEGSLLTGESKSHFEAALASERIDEVKSLLNDQSVKGPDGQLSEQGKARINKAAADATTFVSNAKFDDVTRQQFLAQLRGEVEGTEVGDDNSHSSQAGISEDGDHRGGNQNEQGDDRGQDNRGRGHGGEGSGNGSNNGTTTTANTGTTTTNNNTGTTTDNGTWVPAGQGTGTSGDDDGEDENEREGGGSSGRSHESTNPGGGRDDD